MDLKRYQRQIILPEIGEAGQRRLLNSRVAVVGAGGLGSSSLYYLAAAGIGYLRIIDGDKIEISNLHRQILFSSNQTGSAKAQSAESRLLGLNPEIEIEGIEKRLSAKNVRELLGGVDLVIDGSDNFATRYLVNDACVVMGLPFVAASISRFEGQLSFFNLPGEGGAPGPTYRCLFPEPPSAGMAPSCSESGVLGVLPGVFGSLQAFEAIKYLVGFGELLRGRLLIYNLLTNSFRELSFSVNRGTVAQTVILPQECYDNLMCADVMKNIKEIGPTELKEKLDADPNLCMVDVREPAERELCHIGGLFIPSGEVASRSSEIPKDREVIIYCRSGGRSGDAIAYLSQCGYDNLVNLKGGLLAWAREIDPTMPIV